MANNPPHSTAQEFSTYDITKTRTPDKAKDKTHKHEKNKKQKMGDIQLHFPAHTQDYEPIQKHKLKSRIQMLQYHRQPYQTSKEPRHSHPTINEEFIN